MVNKIISVFFVAVSIIAPTARKHKAVCVSARKK